MGEDEPTCCICIPMDYGMNAYGFFMIARSIVSLIYLFWLVGKAYYYLAMVQLCWTIFLIFLAY